MSSQSERPKAAPAIMGQTKGGLECDNSDVTPPSGYMSLPSDPESSESHLDITESRATNSSTERDMFVCVTSILK